MKSSPINLFIADTQAQYVNSNEILNENETELAQKNSDVISSNTKRKSYFNFFINISNVVNNHFQKSHTPEKKLSTTQIPKNIVNNPLQRSRSIKNYKIPEIVIPQKQSKDSPLIKKVLKSKVFSIIITIALISMLFLDDIRIIFFPEEWDLLIEKIIFGIFIFLATEILLFIIFIKSYRFSVFFFLDIFALIVILPEIKFFFPESENEITVGSFNTKILNFIIGQSSIAKASRAAVAGSKAGRYIDIMYSQQNNKIKSGESLLLVFKNNMMKSKQEKILNRKNMEFIKNSRRDNFNFIDQKDKELFYSKVSNVLNNPKIFDFEKIEEEKVDLLFNISENSPKIKNKNTTEEILIDNLISLISPNDKNRSPKHSSEKSLFHQQLSKLDDNQFNNKIIQAKKKLIKKQTFVMTSRDSFKELFENDDNEIINKNSDSDRKCKRNSSSNKYFNSKIIVEDEEESIDSNDEKYLNEEIKDTDNQNIEKLQLNQGRNLGIEGNDNLKYLGNSNKLESIKQKNFNQFRSSSLGVKPLKNSKIKFKKKQSRKNNINKERKNSLKKISISTVSNDLDSSIDNDDAIYRYSNFHLEPLKRNEKTFFSQIQRIQPSKIRSLRESDFIKNSSTLGNVNSDTNRTLIKKSESLQNEIFISKEKDKNKRKMLRFFINAEENTIYPLLSLLFSKKMTFSVIFLILIMILILPFLDGAAYNSYSVGYIYIADLLKININSQSFTFFIFNVNNLILNKKKRISRLPDLIKISINNTAISNDFNRNLNMIFPNGLIFFDEEKNNHTRLSDHNVYKNGIVSITYNCKTAHEIDSILTIVRILFVSFILWIGAMMFLKDSNKYAVKPLEIISDQIENIQKNIDKFLFDFHFEEAKPKLEIKNLDKFVKINTLLLIKLFGYSTYSYFKNEISVNKKSLTSIPEPFDYDNCIIMLINIKNIDLLCEKFKEEFTVIYSKILEIINFTVFEHFGELVSCDYNEIFCFWKMSNFQRNEKNFDSKVSENSSNSSLNEEYGSFELNKNKDKLTNEKPEYSIEKIMNKMTILDNLPNFAIISGLKIISRLTYNLCISSKLKERGIDKLDLDISFNTGEVLRLIINTDHKIETRYVGYPITLTREIRKISEKYNNQVILTKDFANILDIELLKYTREICKFQNNFNGENIVNIYSLEVLSNSTENKFATYFYENLNVTKETSVILRNEYTRIINNGKFSIADNIKNDSEILFSLSKSSLTFLKLFRYAFLLNKNKQFKQAKDLLETALIFKENDIKSFEMLEEIKLSLKAKH